MTIQNNLLCTLPYDALSEIFRRINLEDLSALRRVDKPCCAVATRCLLNREDAQVPKKKLLQRWAVVPPMPFLDNSVTISVVEKMMRNPLFKVQDRIFSLFFIAQKQNLNLSIPHNSPFNPAIGPRAALSYEEFQEILNSIPVSDNSKYIDFLRTPKNLESLLNNSIKKLNENQITDLLKSLLIKPHYNNDPLIHQHSTFRAPHGVVTKLSLLSIILKAPAITPTHRLSIYEHIAINERNSALYYSLRPADYNVPSELVIRWFANTYREQGIHSIGFINTFVQRFCGELSEWHISYFVKETFNRRNPSSDTLNDYQEVMEILAPYMTQKDITEHLEKIIDSIKIPTSFLEHDKILRLFEPNLTLKQVNDILVPILFKFESEFPYIDSGEWAILGALADRLTSEQRDIIIKNRINRFNTKLATNVIGKDFKCLKSISLRLEPQQITKLLPLLIDLLKIPSVVINFGGANHSHRIKVLELLSNMAPNMLPEQAGSLLQELIPLLNGTEDEREDTEDLLSYLLVLGKCSPEQLLEVYNYPMAVNLQNFIRGFIESNHLVSI